MPLRRTDPRYEFDVDAGRYRYKSTGRLVPDAVVRRALDDAIAEEERQARNIARAVQTGDMTPAQFQREMEKIVTDTQFYSAAAGLGGWQGMTTADAQFVERQVEEQMSWLKALTKELRAGLPRDGQFFNRASSYARAGRTTFYQTDAETKFASGKTRLRNVLHPADHCEGPGSCLEQTDFGWMPIGDARILYPGQRRCRGNCLCTFEYDTGPVEPGPRELRNIAVAARKTDQAIIAQPSSAYRPAQPDAEKTFLRYRLPNGRYTPERERLHEAIIRQQLGIGATQSDDQIVYVMGGGPASGKTSMTDQLDTPNVIVADPDRIKKLLPDYREMVAAGDVGAASKNHEESSELAKEVIRRGVQANYNVLIDGTGDNTYENLREKILGSDKVVGYRDQGGKVVGNYVVLDVENGLARAEERARRPGPNFGRHVPTDYLREVYRNISDIIPKAIRDGLFDDLTIWDNNGDSARVIARYTDGELTVVDRAAWEHFLATGVNQQQTFATEIAEATVEAAAAPARFTPAPGFDPLPRFEPDPGYNPPPMPVGVDNPAPQPAVASSAGKVSEGAETGVAVAALAGARPVDEAFGQSAVDQLTAKLNTLADKLAAGFPAEGDLTEKARYFGNIIKLRDLVAEWGTNIVHDAIQPPQGREPSSIAVSRDMGVHVGGETNPEDWSIVLNANIAPDLANFLAGHRGPREWGSLEVLVHEALHVMSPIHEDPSVFRKPGGQFTEELFTEAVARRLTDKLWGDAPLPDDRHQFAGYRDQERAVEAIEAVRPGTVDGVWSQADTTDRVRELGKGVDAWTERELLPVIDKAGSDFADELRKVLLGSADLDKYRFFAFQMPGVLDDLRQIKFDVTVPNPTDPGAAKFEADELARRILNKLAESDEP